MSHLLWGGEGLGLNTDDSSHVKSPGDEINKSSRIMRRETCCVMKYLSIIRVAKRNEMANVFGGFGDDLGRISDIRDIYHII